MITSIKVTQGFASELPALKKKIKLRPGVNVLVGENGAGKTTLLRLLAAYSGCPERGGWSTWPTPWVCFDSDTSYPERFGATACAHKCQAEVRWDGTASYFSEAAKEDAPVHDLREEGGSFEAVQKTLMMGETSAGEFRMAVIGKVFKSVGADIPDLSRCLQEAGPMNEVWERHARDFEDYVKTLKPTGIPTIILDEPDRGLSLVNQAHFWARMAEVPAHRFQLVISTHSAFAMGVADASFIEMTPGFIRSFAPTLKDASQGWEALAALQERDKR